uniref:hypothetical protein n=1 Tax=unclassified Variovorax TaxID=663243 RepID=UPI000D345FD5
MSAVLATGCANTTTFKKPQDIAWIEATPEKPVLYLLRAPHDNAEVVASIDGVAAALGGPVVALALASRDRTEPDSRNWTECSDLDARGLASIGTYVAAKATAN